MKNTRLNLYHIDMKYIRDLSRVDDKVMSVSPQAGKANRPFVGIVVVCDDKDYCIPLTSPKAKHKNMKNDKDFLKILDKNGEIIGAINLNNMIPVNGNVIERINMQISEKNNKKDIAYKNLLNDQLNWCNKNRDIIINKANKLYHIVTETPDKMRSLTNRCCDFKRLEEVLKKKLT